MINYKLDKMNSCEFTFKRARVNDKLVLRLHLYARIKRIKKTGAVFEWKPLIEIFRRFKTIYLNN